MFSKKKKSTLNKLDEFCAPQWVDFLASPKMQIEDSYFDTDHTIHQPHFLYSPDNDDVDPIVISSTPFNIRNQNGPKTPIVRQPLQPVRIRVLEKMMNISNSSSTINQTILEKKPKTNSSAARNKIRIIGGKKQPYKLRTNPSNKENGISKFNFQADKKTGSTTRAFEGKKQACALRTNGANKENELKKFNFQPGNKKKIEDNKKASSMTRAFKVLNLKPVDIKKDKAPSKKVGQQLLTLKKVLPSTDTSEDDLEKTLCPEPNIPSNNLCKYNAQSTIAKNSNNEKSLKTKSTIGVKSKSAKYISLAEAVDKFQHDIPTRFRKTKLEMNKKCGKLTLAVSPELKSKTRIRALNQVDAIPKGKLKNDNLVKKKPVTVPQPFNLTECKKKTHPQDKNPCPNQNKGTFKTASLSFEERNQRLWEKKRQFWKKNVEEINSSYKFHARPAPKFKAIVVKGTSQKIVKKTKNN